MKLIWIIEARYIENFKIYLKFNDGKEGIVDLQNKLKGKIFIPLQEMEYFNAKSHESVPPNLIESIPLNLIESIPLKRVSNSGSKIVLFSFFFVFSGWAVPG
jgi:hypothetical protein